MWIVEFTNYKTFLSELIKSYPKHGRGQAARLAEHLKTTPMVISHIMTRERHFTADQALEVARFFGLGQIETEYFIFMVSLARADSQDLKQFYEQKLNHLRDEANKIKASVVGKEFLSEAEKGVFYSNWYYAAISCLVSIKGFQTIDAIADYFDLPRDKVGEWTSFLVASGICRQDGGLVLSGKTSSHVSEPSPYLNNHRRNWRLKAIEAFSVPDPLSIHFSGPVSLSKQDALAIQKGLRDFIRDFSKRIAPSREETLRCLNIDWFGY